MKKYFVLAIVLALLSLICPVFAGVAINDIDGYVGEATNIDITGQKTTFDGSTVTVLANGHKEGVTTRVSQESNLTSAALAFGTILIADTGSGVTSRSISIANGTPGQMVTIILQAATGVATLFITDDGVAHTAMTNTGWDDIAFNAANDSVTLLYLDDTYGWIIIGGNSVTIT